MSYSKEQWIKAISKLLNLTSSNEIKWEKSDLFQGDSWTIVDQCLQAEFNGKLYSISQTRRKYFLDEENYVWSSHFDLSIYIKSPRSDYERIASAPDLSSLAGLYQAAENNLAYNEDALGDLL